MTLVDLTARMVNAVVALVVDPATSVVETYHARLEAFVQERCVGG